MAKNIKFLHVRLLPCLEMIMKQNTAFYQSDLQEDARMLERAAAETDREKRVLLWFSRECGTECFLERDVFLRGTRANISWMYYAEQKSERFLAYAVEVTGVEYGDVMGNLYQLDFAEMCDRIAAKALPADQTMLRYEHWMLTIPSAARPPAHAEDKYGKLLELDAKNNEKAHKYAGQLISIIRKTAVLSVNDRISHVDESADATYLELLHPASVYRMSILGDITNGLSAEANIRPEDVKQIMMRLEFAEKLLFDRQTEKKLAGQPDEKLPPAFGVTFSFGKMKGETPGGYLFKAEDKQAALKELRSQYDFLAQNAEKFASNQKVMDAIKNAFDCYKQGTLNDLAGSAPQVAAKTGKEAILYNPPEKTFRRDTKILPDGTKVTKCYLITISFIPSNNYPYQISIRNRYCEVKKDAKTGLEKINPEETDKSETREYKMSLTSGEMISLINAMDENLHLYKSCVYKTMRQIDSKKQEENRKAWRPQS